MVASAMVLAAAANLDAKGSPMSEASGPELRVSFYLQPSSANEIDELLVHGAII